MSTVLRHRLAVMTFILLGMIGLAGCKDDAPIFRDAGPDARVDAGDVPVDAAVDASPPLPAYEITGGAGAVRGTRFSADVQIGHGFDQAPVGATTTAEGNAAVKP